MHGSYVFLHTYPRSDTLSCPDEEKVVPGENSDSRIFLNRFATLRNHASGLPASSNSHVRVCSCNPGADARFSSLPLTTGSSESNFAQGGRAHEAAAPAHGLVRLLCCGFADNGRPRFDRRQDLARIVSGLDPPATRHPGNDSALHVDLAATRARAVARRASSARSCRAAGLGVRHPQAHPADACVA